MVFLNILNILAEITKTWHLAILGININTSYSPFPSIYVFKVNNKALSHSREFNSHFSSMKSMLLFMVFHSWWWAKT